MGAPEHLAAAHEMCRLVDQRIEQTRYRGREQLTIPLDAVLVGQGSGHCLYECTLPPHAWVGEDTEVAVSTGESHAAGRVVRVEGTRCTFAVDQALGDQISGWLTFDGTELDETLRDRLAEISATGLATAFDHDSFQFELATAVLGAPGGRLYDEIAQAAESTETWSLDDRESDLLRTALRYRSAYVQDSPGADPVAIVPRLLDRLLELGASVLFVAPTHDQVDRAVLALCSRLAQRDRPRSGLVQRLGPITLPELRDRYGPMIDPEEIRTDLQAGLEQRLAGLRLEDLRLRTTEASQRYDIVYDTYTSVAQRLERARAQSSLLRVLRLGNRDKPEELLVTLYRMRPDVKAARAARDAMVTELAQAEAARATQLAIGPGTGSEPPSGARSITIGERRREIAETVAELEAAGGEIERTLRRRCRLMATTVGQVLLHRLPRPTADVVVVAGQVSPPMAFFLAGLATRSVIRIGGPDRLLGAAPLVALPVHDGLRPVVPNASLFSHDVAGRRRGRRGLRRASPR